MVGEWRRIRLRRDRTTKRLLIWETPMPWMRLLDATRKGLGARKTRWVDPACFGSFFFFFLWLVFLFYLIHSRGFGGKGFTTSSSFSWDWREVFFFFGAMREGRIPKTREASHDFILISISFFSISRRRIGWVATCGISHPLKSIYLFYEARQTHKFWVVGQQCVFSLPAIKKKFFQGWHLFFFLFDTQFKAAKYYRLAEENGSRTLGNSWYVIPSLLPTFLLSLASFFFFPVSFSSSISHLVQGVP